MLFRSIGAAIFREEKAAAEAKIQTLPTDSIYFYGSDIDKNAVALSQENARRAEVAQYIRFKRENAFFQTPTAVADWTGLERALILCNPPYGERLLSAEEATEIYRKIGSTFLTEKGTCKKGVRLSVISPDDTFEKAVGYKADKRRKLYNGNIKCQLYHFYRL